MLPEILSGRIGRSRRRANSSTVVVAALSRFGCGTQTMKCPVAFSMVDSRDASSSRSSGPDECGVTDDETPRNSTEIEQGGCCPADWSRMRAARTDSQNWSTSLVDVESGRRTDRSAISSPLLRCVGRIADTSSPGFTTQCDARRPSRNSGPLGNCESAVGALSWVRTPVPRVNQVLMCRKLCALPVVPTLR